MLRHFYKSFIISIISGSLTTMSPAFAAGTNTTDKDGIITNTQTHKFDKVKENDMMASLTMLGGGFIAARMVQAYKPMTMDVMIAGAVEPSTRLKWDDAKDDDIVGYKVYWRDTTSPQWQYSRFVGEISDYTLKNIVIDNYLFGVASVGKNGVESLIQFPRKQIPTGM